MDVLGALTDRSKLRPFILRDLLVSSLEELLNCAQIVRQACPLPPVPVLPQDLEGVNANVCRMQKCQELVVRASGVTSCCASMHVLCSSSSSIVSM
eukprot:1161749-Pelagomonas_calceolata.AAC.3